MQEECSFLHKSVCFFSVICFSHDVFFFHINRIFKKGLFFFHKM